MNVFNSLIRLYKVNGLKTPLEDFTSEILTNVFAEHIDISTAFVNKVLGIPGESFTASSQECYSYIKNGRSFIKLILCLRMRIQFVF